MFRPWPVLWGTDARADRPKDHHLCRLRWPMTSLLRTYWLDIARCLLLQATLVGGGHLLASWTPPDPPCCVQPQAL